MWTLAGWRVERMCWFIALPGLTGRSTYPFCTCVYSYICIAMVMVTGNGNGLDHGHGWLWPRGVMTMIHKWIWSVGVYSVYSVLGDLWGLKKLKMGKSKMNLLQGRHHCHSLSDAFRGAWCQEGSLLDYLKESTYLWSSLKSFWSACLFLKKRFYLRRRVLQGLWGASLTQLEISGMRRDNTFYTGWFFLTGTPLKSMENLG